MNIFKTYFFCLCCCLLASSFSTDLFANVNDCIEDDMACEETLVVSNRMNDSLALVALYNATDGANWTNTWDLNQPMDTWYGVTLDGNGQVILLILDTNRLTGSIPIELSQLTSLTFLDFYNNDLNGNIPIELAQLLNLESLWLSTNELTGTIPTQLSQLSNLNHLYLDHNQLSGNIPDELSQLSNLNNLYLDHNQLSGSIPVELSQLSNLNNLHLEHNQLSGSIPTELGNLSNLTRLYLDHNQLSGSIPAELGNLSNLNHFYLNNNQLSGSIPVELSQLSNLNNLHLEHNQLSGSIPTELGNLSNLTRLYLDHNQLSGSIPAELGNLSNLNHFYLNNNQLSGSIPAELGNLSNLNHFYLNNNQLSGSIPAELGNLSNLTRLKLHNNQLEGCFPTELYIFCDLGFSPSYANITGYNFTNNLNLPGGGDFEAFCSSNGNDNCLSGCAYRDSLALVALYNATDGANWTNTWDLNQPINTWFGVTLDEDRCVTSISLHNNQLSGTIPIELGQLSNLMRLSLSNNGLSSSTKLSGSIPIELGQLSNLTELFLGGNELSGSIPVELGQLSNLTHLSFWGNELSGAIPIELGQLSNLLYLSLSGNELSGSIPVELGQLSNLRNLHLYENQLSGSIPVELGQLSNLTRLHLYENQLSGSIPIELGQLSNLGWLHLGNNELSGVIPVELGQLSNFTYLSLYENQLSGTIPVELGQLSNLIGLSLYGNQLSGVIPVELGQLSNLRDLHLYENQLSGTIPVELGQLLNLKRLYLHNNQLNGCFPSELSTFCDLGFSNNSIIEGYNFTNNPSLPDSGDFEAFCNNGTGSCQTSDVWPGDINADGCVNNDDVLLLNVKNGKIGSNRPNASSNWEGQPATDWGDATPDDIDAKHADCNGDGLVDSSTDSPVISINYGKKHGNAANSSLDNFDGDATVNSQWDNPATSGNANFASNNDNIQLSIDLEQLIGNQSDFYGIGFTLDYSTVSTGVNLSIDNSAMGQENQDLFAFSQEIEEGKMDVAVVRTDGNNISTSGSNDPLCQLIFQLDGASNEEELHLKFQNIKVIDALGNETTPMLGASTTVAFGPANNGTSNNQVSRSSTPLQMLVHATFATDCDNGAIGTATPYGGTAPFTYQWDNGSTTAQTTNLSVGMHRITITDANQQSLVGNIEVFGNCSALPLDLLSFRASPQQAAIQLDWLTANEVGITSFDIQRSTNGVDFSTIQTLTAKGKNSATTAYQIVDNEVVSNQTYYYHIKTNEANKSHFSPIRTVRLVDTFKEIIALPNPVKDELTLYLDEANQEAIQVIIYNQMGQQMKVLEYNSSASLSIDWSTYPKGLYVITITQGGQRQVLKIIKE